jgi:hypothetical protein
MPGFWDTAFEEAAAAAGAANDSVGPDKIAAKRAAERARAFRNGWIDADGNAVSDPDDSDDSDDSL